MKEYMLYMGQMVGSLFIVMCCITMIMHLFAM